MAKKVKINTNKEIKVKRKQIVDLVDNLYRWSEKTEGINRDLANDLWLANNVLGYLVVSGAVHKKGVVIPPTEKKKKAKQEKQDRRL
jgi:hypothetical protein